MGMYVFDGYLREALTGASPDYVAVSHAGHGSNSYAINYQLVDGPLVVCAQAPWGGVYEDRDETTRRIAALFERVAALIHAADRAKAADLFAPTGRLYVFESHMRDSYVWGWLPNTLPGDESARAWLKQHRLRFDRAAAPLTATELPTAAACRFITTEWTIGS
jgi:hypothetical protein